jgi:hypothetical protein
VDFVFPDNRERQSFLATPFPSDLLILDDGRLDLRTFPNPFGSTTLEDFLAIFETAPAWAGTTTMYFRVEGGVDESTLPQTAAASVQDDSGLFVIELSGPRAGRRLPIEWQHYPEGTAFLPPGTVAVSLLLGAVPEGRFALVATSTLRHADGTKLGPSADFKALLACELPDLDRDVDCAPYQALPETLGLPADDIAVAAVITPRDSSAGLVKAAATAKAFAPTVAAPATSTATTASSRWRSTRPARRPTTATTARAAASSSTTTAPPSSSAPRTCPSCSRCRRARCRPLAGASSSTATAPAATSRAASAPALATSPSV